MRRYSRIGRNIPETYKELAGGLLVALVSELVQLLGGTNILQLQGFYSLLGLVPVAVIVAYVATGVDEAAPFLIGYVLLSLLFFLSGLIGLGALLFDSIFAVVAVFTVFYMRNSGERRIDPVTYGAGVSIGAVILAFVFLAFTGVQPVAITTTTTTANTTSTVASVSTTSIATTSIARYSGCSTIELDQPIGCQSPLLAQPGNLSFTLFSTDSNSTLYGINLACTNTFGLAQPSQYQFYYLQANGTFSQGLPGTSITATAPISAKLLPCYGVTNSTAPFNGILWVQYRPGNVATPQQTEHIQVYYNVTAVPSLVHVNSTAGENLTALSR